MLTPGQMEAAAEGLSPIFEDLEDFVVRDLVRRLIAAEGQWTGTAELQSNFGVAAGVSLDDVVLAISRAMGLAEDELAAVFNKAGALNILSENERLTGAGLSAIKIERLPFLQQIVEEVIIQTRGTLRNMSRSTAIGIVRDTVGGRMFMGLQAYYQHSVDTAMLKVRAGVQSPTQAIRDAIKELSVSGLSINYGSGYNSRLDVAVRRAVLTGINQMATIQNAQIADDLGLPLAEVTAHQGARPSHAEWQGKVFQIRGSSKKYKNLAMATGMGKVWGLLGANCRHSWHGFAEGMPRTWTDEMLDNVDPPPFEYRGHTYDAYGATQYQRAMERSIRSKKRELVGYDAAGDTDAFEAASKELKDIRKEYKRFSERADLRLKNERAQVLGYGRSISQKSVQAAKKYEEKLRKAAEERAIIKEIKETGIKGQEFTLKPKKINLDEFEFDDQHINKDNKRNISREEAESYVENAVMMVTRYDGKSLNYYSKNGATYVRIDKKLIRTAFSETDFDKKTESVMEVLRKWNRLT